MGILYGHRCVLCGADFPVTTSRTLQLCPDCAAAVRREYRCNEVISIAGADGTIAPLYYRGTVRNAMKRFKFSSAAYCADWFAAQMCAALTSQLEEWQPDLITYMPIGFLHYRKRGYNQAELLAKLTAKGLLERKACGKNVALFLTPHGLAVTQAHSEYDLRELKKALHLLETQFSVQELASFYRVLQAKTELMRGQLSP